MKRQPLVLLIDDIVENLKILGNIFKKENYQIAIAQDGKTGINIARTKLPDIILLDIQMPLMDGFEVCKILKDDIKTKDIPILFLTAKSEEEDIIKGFELGAIDYITKPFNNKELLARVKTQLENKFLKEELKNSNNELTQISASKDKFFSIIAHDLRTPFIALLGFSEIIKEDFDSLSSDEIKEYIRIIYTTASDTYKLLDNLLQWSRIQLKKMDFAKKSFNTKELITNIVTLSKLQAVNKKITLIDNSPKDRLINVDRNMFETIFRNLISNAIKFSKEGQEVSINYTEDDDYQTISVKDSGIGIPQVNREKLFKMDQNVSTNGTSNEKGTGLGLLLCKEMVELHNGKIWFDTSDNGTIFYVAFPKMVISSNGK